MGYSRLQWCLVNSFHGKEDIILLRGHVETNPTEWKLFHRIVFKAVALLLGSSGWFMGLLPTLERCLGNALEYLIVDMTLVGIPTVILRQLNRDIEFNI